MADKENGREKHKGHHVLCCTHFMGGLQREWKRYTKIIMCFAVYTSWVASKENGREKHKSHLLYCTCCMGGWQREWKRETQRSSCALLYTLHGWLAKRMVERNTKVIVCFTVHTSWVAGIKNWRDNHKSHHLLCCTHFMGGWQREWKSETQRSSCALLYSVHTSWVASMKNQRDNHKGHQLLYCTHFMGG